MQQNQVELDFLEMVEIDQAANIMRTTVKALLKEAANRQRLLYVALAAHEATLVAIPSHHAPLHAKRSPSGTIFVALYAPYCVELALRGSVEVKMWHASTEDEGPFAWHYWHLDKPQTVELDMVFVPERDVVAGVTTVTQPGRQHRVASLAAAPLAAEIKVAKAKAVDSDDATSVWAELVKLSEVKFGCLIGADEDTIKYQDGEAVLNFKKRSLRERMRRERSK
ncbi:hypothetical protein ASF04_07995 [Duganella sp. Leaf61]|uniref:hypothetical protein n=1 Tax=Duganella sp. Leaf61 TaxID=1736227 RepID=UPI0006F6A7FF|nr:hypothetical protein [Duganella sp. Leaf61]KQN73064.1 hypothetical protein ASF04_07995 [Duganella sp. Leaf61]